MALPKKKSTRTRRRTRASHFALKKIALVLCSRCQKMIKPHYVCPFCGYYRGNDVLHLERKLEKQVKRSHKKQTSS